MAVTITLTGTPIIVMVPILISTMPAVESLDEDDAEAFAASISEDALLILPPSTLPPPWLLLPLVHALVGHTAHVSHRPHPGVTVLRIAATLEEGNCRTPRITANASLELCHNELAGSSSCRCSSSSRERRDTSCHWAPDCRVYNLDDASGTTLSTGEDRRRRHTCACVRSGVRSSRPPRRFGHRTSSPSPASVRHRRTQ